MATRINSSLVPELFDVPSTGNTNVIDTPIPEGMQWPQWVNNQWQEYRVEDDPCVQNNPVPIE